MIRIIAGVAGMPGADGKMGTKAFADGPFASSAEHEARLVEKGRAVYVDAEGLALNAEDQKKLDDLAQHHANAAVQEARKEYDRVLDRGITGMPLQKATAAWIKAEADEMRVMHDVAKRAGHPVDVKKTGEALAELEARYKKLVREHALEI